MSVAPSTVEMGVKKEYAYLRFIPLIILHLSCLLVIYVGFSWPALIVAFLGYVIRMFAITGFFHRYFAHRSFKTNRVVQFIFAFIGTASLQRGPLWWAANHRNHHKYSDQPQDTHSPFQLNFFDSHIGWVYWKSNIPTKTENIKDFAKYPEIRFLDKWDLVPAIVYLGMLIGAGYLCRDVFGWASTSPLQLVVWGFCISTVVLLHMVCSVNTVCHLSGKQKFKTTDYSRNNWWMAIFTLGEGWHNNHHRFPNSMKQGFLWYEYDVSSYIIKFFKLIGLASDIKPVPPNIMEEAKTSKYFLPTIEAKAP